MCSDENTRRWLVIRGDEKVLLLRLRGWKWFVYIFFFMKISKFAFARSAPRENPTTRFSYHRAEARKTLFTRSRSAFPRCQPFYQCENMLRGFTFLLRDEFTRMKSLNDSLFRWFGLNKKCVLRERPRERMVRWIIHLSGDTWTFTGSAAFHCIARADLNIELTSVALLHRNRCTKTFHTLTSQLFTVHVSSRVVGWAH